MLSVKPDCQRDASENSTTTSLLPAHSKFILSAPSMPPEGTDPLLPACSRLIVNSDSLLPACF
jgi:hypothetical protein